MVFFSILLIPLGRIVAEEDKKYEYYSEKFKKIQEQIDEEHEDDDGYKVGALRDLINDLHARISRISDKAVWDAAAADHCKKCIKAYFKINSVYKACSHDFRQLSYEYNGWKNEKVDPTDANENAERNKSKYASEIVSVDTTQTEIKKELEGFKSEIQEIFSILSNNLLGVTHNTQILDFIASFCVLGGSIWMILGTITLAGSLKDKNGPTLQTSIWQIVGGTMMIFATYLFKNSAQYPKLLNDVLWLASQFSRVGGAMWAAWGFIILAGAVKDQTGPALQSAIWQIVGGIMIIMASYLFTYVVKVIQA